MLRKEVCMPILALVLISLGGLMLHVRIHPLSEEASNAIPLVVGLLSVIVLPWLFDSPKTVAMAYILNIATVVVGTVAMTLESIETWQGPVTLYAVIFQSTLADIVILMAKLPIGHAILRHFRPKGQP